MAVPQLRGEANVDPAKAVTINVTLERFSQMLKAMLGESNRLTAGSKSMHLWQVLDSLLGTKLVSTMRESVRIKVKKWVSSLKNMFEWISKYEAPAC